MLDQVGVYFHHCAWCQSVRLRKLLALLLLAGCAGTAPTLKPTPAPIAHPTPEATPAPTLVPTPAPPSLGLGKLSFTSTACWQSSFTDSEGHRDGGISIDWKVKATNKGTTPVHVWMWLVANVHTELGKTSWKGSGNYWTLSDGSVLIPGPDVKTDAVVSWSTVLFTSFDANWELSVFSGPVQTTKGTTAILPETPDGYWQGRTASNVC